MSGVLLYLILSFLSIFLSIPLFIRKYYDYECQGRKTRRRRPKNNFSSFPECSRDSLLTESIPCNLPDCSEQRTNQSKMFFKIFRI